MIFGRNPTVIAGAIAIAINLAITFGLKLTAEQVSLINALVIAILAIIVRDQVTPVSDPKLPVGTSVNSGTATVSGPPPVPTVDVKP